MDKLPGDNLDQFSYLVGASLLIMYVGGVLLGAEPNHSRLFVAVIGGAAALLFGNQVRKRYLKR